MNNKNLYEPHPIQIDSGTFWRCDHGKTGFGKEMKWIGCFWCAVRKPIIYLYWRFPLF